MSAVTELIPAEVTLTPRQQALHRLLGAAYAALRRGATEEEIRAIVSHGIRQATKDGNR